MMNDKQIFLARLGAVFAGDVVQHFGDPRRELAAAASETIIADVSHEGLLHASGADATIFLQGQLTQDISKITAERAALAGYCSPKGRLLAHFLIWQQDDGYYLQLPRELVAPIQKRLQMFVLRSKVKLQDISAQSIRFGLAGPEVATLLETTFGAVPQSAWTVATSARGRVIAMPGGRYQVIPSDVAQACWTELAATAMPVGSPCWTWLRIKSGIPEIYLATQEQLVPQMVNDDLIGAVNFQKGCYTGQEIVARLHYLGKSKRRMYRAHLNSEAAPKPGDLLYSADMQGQSSGMVVDAATSPDRGWDLLASIQVDSAASQIVNWLKLGGEPLAVESFSASAV
ncbi:MAG: folate-binding protein [Burkholderiales bacterium]